MQDRADTLKVVELELVGREGSKHPGSSFIISVLMVMVGRNICQRAVNAWFPFAHV